MQSPSIIDREFLPARAKILELAASLDRLDRSGFDPADVKREKLQRAVQLLLEEGGNRAEAVQMLFSREYDGDWRIGFQLD